MDNGAKNFFIVTIIIGASAFFFFMSQNVERKESLQEKEKESFVDLRVDFVDRLYEKDGVTRIDQEIRGIDDILDSPKVTASGSAETKGIRLQVQEFLKENYNGLYWVNLEKEEDLTILFLRGTLTYTDSGMKEQELFSGLAGILFTQEAQDLVVYRNGRPELFNILNGQSEICLPEKEDLDLLGKFTEETGVVVEEVERFEIQNWFKRGFVVRVTDMEGFQYEAEITTTDRSPTLDEYSLDCSKASIGVFDVGGWVIKNLGDTDSEVRSSQTSS